VLTLFAQAARFFGTLVALFGTSQGRRRRRRGRRGRRGGEREASACIRRQHAGFRPRWPGSGGGGAVAAYAHFLGAAEKRTLADVDAGRRIPRAKRRRRGGGRARTRSAACSPRVLGRRAAGASHSGEASVAVSGPHAGGSKHSPLLDRTTSRAAPHLEPPPHRPTSRPTRRERRCCPPRARANAPRTRKKPAPAHAAANRYSRGHKLTSRD